MNIHEGKGGRNRSWYLAFLVTLQFNIESGSPIPLECDALWSGDDDEITNFFYSKRRVRFQSHRLSTHKLHVIVVGSS